MFKKKFNNENVPYTKKNNKLRETPRFNKKKKVVFNTK